MRPRQDLAESFRGTAPFFTVIGDASKPSNVRNATRTGHDAALARTAGLGLRVFLMRIPAGGNADTILRQASADRRALWVQFDFAHRTMEGSNAAASKQYALAKIRADSLPQAARGQSVSVLTISVFDLNDMFSIQYSGRMANTR